VPTTPRLALPYPEEIDAVDPPAHIQALAEAADSAILARFPTVRDYGAIGDGVTDDHAAFQAAIDAAHTVYLASNHPQVLIVPNGRYYLPCLGQRAVFPGFFDRPLAVALRSGVVLLGLGGAVLYTPTASSGEENEATIAPVDGTLDTSVMDASHWGLRGLIFEGDQLAYAAETNGSFLALGAGSDWAITECVFRKHRGDAITLNLGGAYAIKRGRIDRNIVESCVGNAIGCTFFDTSTTEDLSVCNNVVRDPYAPAEAIFVQKTEDTASVERVQVCDNDVLRYGPIGCIGIDRIDIDRNRIIANPDSEGVPAISFNGCADISLSENDIDISGTTMSAFGNPEGAAAVRCAIKRNRLKMGSGRILYVQPVSGQTLDLVFSDNEIQTTADFDDADQVRITGGAVAAARVTVEDNTFGDGTHYVVVNVNGVDGGRGVSRNTILRGRLGVGGDNAIVCENRVIADDVNDTLAYNGNNGLIARNRLKGEGDAVIDYSGLHNVIQGNIIETAVGSTTWHVHTPDPAADYTFVLDNQLLGPKRDADGLEAGNGLNIVLRLNQ
jgi:hypothetical protein